VLVQSEDGLAPAKARTFDALVIPLRGSASDHPVDVSPGLPIAAMPQTHKEFALEKCRTLQCGVWQQVNFAVLTFWV